MQLFAKPFPPRVSVAITFLSYRRSQSTAIFIPVYYLLHVSHVTAHDRRAINK